MLFLIKTKQAGQNVNGVEVFDDQIFLKGGIMTKSILVAVIGGGNMGGAILSGIYQDFQVTVCDQDSQKTASLRRRYGVKTDTLANAVAGRDVVILAVKPQDFDSVLSVIEPCLTAKQVVVSIAAGITTRLIERKLGGGPRVVRVMPNLPALIGQGISAVAGGASAKKKDILLVSKIFASVGQTVVVEEKLMDSVTAVSGSGPAYVFYFAEILQATATRMGLAPFRARQLVLQTLKGSVAMLESRQADAADLRKKVTSKGGTTAAAMDVLIKSKTDKIFDQALRAARQRAGELSR